MYKRYVCILIVLSFQIITTGQDVSYTTMDMAAFAKSMKNTSTQKMYNRNLQFHFDLFAGRDLDAKKAEKESAQAALQVNALQKKFSTQEKFPDSIAPGWHSAVLTDNKAFYKDVKLLVSKNTVVQLVIGDCIRMPITANGKIKDATSTIALKYINTEYAVLYVYFVNDLDRTALIAEPVQPGYVCFWTSKSRYVNERLFISGTMRDFIKDIHEVQPACFAPGVPFYIMKPGKYNFRVTVTGNDKEGGFEIKPGMCLMYGIK